MCLAGDVVGNVEQLGGSKDIFRNRREIKSVLSMTLKKIKKRGEGEGENKGENERRVQLLEITLLRKTNLEG